MWEAEEIGEREIWKFAALWSEGGKLRNFRELGDFPNARIRQESGSWYEYESGRRKLNEVKSFNKMNQISCKRTRNRADGY